MAFFYGTSESDVILRDSISAGVTTDPAGLAGTAGGAEAIYGYGGDDVLQGPNGAFFTSILGGTGDDVLLGGDGLDVLDGGPGSDLMIGGDEQDFYVVDRRSDRIIDLGTTEGDTADTVYTGLNAYVLPRGVEALTMHTNLDSDAAPPTSRIGFGNELANTIIGTTITTSCSGWAATTRCGAGAAPTESSAAMGTTTCRAPSSAMGGMICGAHPATIS